MPDNQLLQMALVGYEAERQRIHSKITELQRQLKIRNHRAAAPAAATPARPGRRRMSAAARKRIGEAQKKRWAEYRKKRKTA